MTDMPLSISSKISIHAPLTGSDSGPQWRSEQLKDFNPRSPYGERQLKEGSNCINNLFQSTLPLRGATPTDILQSDTIWISIHAPLTGSDQNS